jgi:hypothetical protein
MLAIFHGFSVNRNTPQNNYSYKMFPDKFVDNKHDQTSNPDSRIFATPSSDRNTQVVDRTPKMNHMSGMAYKKRRHWILQWQ